MKPCPVNAQRALRRLHLQPVERIPHWEHFSNPDFFTLISGIDYYEHPRQSAQRVAELLPLDMGIGIPATDDPIAPPPSDSSWTDEEGHRHVRWGTGASGQWEWGNEFKTVEDALAYQPLEHLDLREAPSVVVNADFSVSVEALARGMQGGDLPAPGGPRAGTLKGASFYNTCFMWPLLTFGWEIFLELAGGHKEELKRVMADFAAISRKFFTAVSLTDVDFCVCHDDICLARGLVCSPAWMREMVYPYYEEFWGIMKASGIKVIFMTDGNPDQVADDIFACGADGLISEPFGDYAEIARKHPDKVLAGEGDNRILQSRDKDAIEAMTKRMCEMGHRYPGYINCIGNHIPWNVPPDAIQWYFEFADQYGWLE